MNFQPSLTNTSWANTTNGSQPNNESPDIIYRRAQPKHRQAALEVLTQAFINEPSTAGQSIGRPRAHHWRRFTNFYMDECLTNNLSVVALDSRNRKTVAGVFINRDFLTPPDQDLIDFVQPPSPFAPVAEAIDILDEAWFQSHPEIQRHALGRVVDLWMVGVHPDYCGKGIARNLARCSLESAARAGFEYAIVECTGAYSQQVMEAVGCNPVAELAYADFRWEGQAIFKEVPKPHTKWAIYEKRLN